MDMAAGGSVDVGEWSEFDKYGLWDCCGWRESKESELSPGMSNGYTGDMELSIESSIWYSLLADVPKSAK